MGSPAGFSKESERKDKAPGSPPPVPAGAPGWGGGFPDAELVSGLSGEKIPILSLGGWPRVPILHLPVLLWGTPQKPGGLLGQDTLLSGPKAPKMQDVGQDSFQPRAEGTLAIRTFSALLS